MAHRRRISLAFATGIVSTVAWACAVGQNGDISSDFGPTEPEVDASYDPRPATSQSATVDAGSSSGSSGSGSKNSTPAPSGSSSSSGSSTSSSSGGTPPASTVPKPTQGEVLITEVMYDPSTPEPAGEWIEVHNAAPAARSLSGLTLFDSAGRAHTIGSGVELAAGAYKVLVRNQAGAVAAKVPQAAILYEYGAGVDDSSGVLLVNGTTGAVRLRDGSTEIAQAVYGGWFTTAAGKSVQLATTSYAASQSKSGWCLSANAWATGADKGTPGAPEDCP